MYGRNVSFKPKAKSKAEVTCVLKDEIIPLLRRQKGFDHALSFIASERNEAVTISLWGKKVDAKPLQPEDMS